MWARGGAVTGGTPPEKKPGRRPRQFAAGVALVLGACLVAIATIEILARLLFTDGTNFDVEMWRYTAVVATDPPLTGTR